MYKKIIAIVCAAAMLMTLLAGCAGGKNDERVSNAKENVENHVRDTIRSVDASGAFLEAAVDSLEFNYTKEQVKGNELTLEGEFSYVLVDKKYIQPFSVTGDLDSGELSFTTAGMDMRVEDSSEEERARNDYVREMNEKSDSEKEEIAKQTAAQAVLDKMESSTWPLYSSWYDLDNSRISYGKISANGDTYTIMGQVFLYDNYGSLSETVQFKVTTLIDESGYVSGTSCFLED